MSTPIIEPQETSLACTYHNGWAMIVCYDVQGRQAYYICKEHYDTVTKLYTYDTFLHKEYYAIDGQAFLNCLTTLSSVC